MQERKVIRCGSFIAFLLFTTISTAVYGQDSLQTISGKVTSAKDGTPLPGTTVILKGQKRNGHVVGTNTDSTGEYHIKVSALKGTLVFSFTGFQKQKVKINGRTTINVQLKP